VQIFSALLFTVGHAIVVGQCHGLGLREFEPPGRDSWVT
jgi:hypothetical protein